MRYCVAAVLALLVGCAQQPIASWRPLVDTKGIDQAKFDRDYQECAAYALQVAGPGTGAVSGAVAGAAVGYLFARLIGSDVNSGQMARVGAGAGALGGAGAGMQNETNVTRQCLRGRGYNVLN